MKKQLLSFGALFTLSISCFATPVKMPNAEVLRQRLPAFEHFDEKTQFIKKIAEKKLEPYGVAVTIQHAFADYNHYLKDDPNRAMIMRSMTISAPLLLEACLKDYPEALKELQEKGLYTPIRAES
jgi:hypothetical protein